MARPPLLLLQAVDVRRATEAGSDRKTIIKTLAIPPIKFKTVSHDAGGGVGEVNFVMPRIEPLEPKFEVAGIDTDIFRDFGRRTTWTFAGAYRDTKRNVSVSCRGIIEAAVNGWEPDESDPAEFQGCTHEFAECTHFEMTLGDGRLFYYDFDEIRLETLDGQDVWGEVRRALG